MKYRENPYERQNPDQWRRQNPEDQWRRQPGLPERGINPPKKPFPGFPPNKPDPRPPMPPGKPYPLPGPRPPRPRPPRPNPGDDAAVQKCIMTCKLRGKTPKLPGYPKPEQPERKLFADKY